jgi:hypothetical protein
MSMKVTRREALKKIGRTAGSILVTNTFIMALTTAPISSISSLFTARADTTLNPANSLFKSPASEKIVINGGGSTLNFKISGQAGRSCAVVYRLSGSRTPFQPFFNTKTLITPNGQAGMSVNTKTIPDGIYDFGVVTAGTSEFRTDIKGTEAFQARIKDGQIVELIGPGQRETMTNATCATAGAPGLISKQF